MDDIDLTRDRSFSPPRNWFGHRHGGRLELSTRNNPGTGMLQVFLTDPAKEIFEPWYSPNGELIKNDFFGFLTRDDSDKGLDRTCDRCGKILRPWDMYGLCAQCEETLQQEKVETMGRIALSIGNSRG